MFEKLKSIFSVAQTLTTNKDIEFAQSLVDSMNNSLRIANNSNKISEREAYVAKTKSQLEELKSFTKKHPAIPITNQDLFELSIKGVEEETEQLKRNKTSVQHNQATENKNELIDSVKQSHFKVINESIKMARDSKNIETKISRINVARNSLNSLREEASKFKIIIDGLDEADLAINEIDQAIKSGLSTSEICIPEMPDYYYSPARELLKKATIYKKEKRFDDACNALKEAYTLEGNENLMIEERLRLPMYLLLAGKNEEGWEELSNLNSIYRDDFSQQIIAKQLNIFCKKEGRNREPLFKETLNVEGMESKNNLARFELHSGNSFKAFIENQDVIEGLEFSATMQLRTPLRVLLKHGELHKDPNISPPSYTKELWEGIWIAKSKSWRELGLDIDELHESLVASEIGPIKVSEYLPFLIAVRTVIERHETIDVKINELHKLLLSDQWQTFISKHGGKVKLINLLFPCFIDTIPALSNDSIKELRRLALLTANDIEKTSDSELLNIKGIGKAKLNKIRDYCAAVAENRDNQRVDSVRR